MSIELVFGLARISKLQKMEMCFVGQLGVVQRCAALIDITLVRMRHLFSQCTFCEAADEDALITVSAEREKIWQ
jgi:hypothetical protein